MSSDMAVAEACTRALAIPGGLLDTQAGVEISQTHCSPLTTHRKLQDSPGTSQDKATDPFHSPRHASAAHRCFSPPQRPINANSGVGQVLVLKVFVLSMAGEEIAKIEVGASQSLSTKALLRQLSCQLNYGGFQLLTHQGHLVEEDDDVVDEYLTLVQLACTLPPLEDLPPF